MTKAGATNFSNDILGYNKLDAGQADLQTAKSGAVDRIQPVHHARVPSIRSTTNISSPGPVRRDGFSGFGKNHKFRVSSAALGGKL